MVIINKINRQRGGVTRLSLDNGRRLDWPSPVVTESGLEEQQEIPEAELEEKLWKAARKLIGQKARDYLGRYLKTTQQFTAHFRRKGYPEELISPLVEDLKEEGYLNDDEVARQHIYNRCRSKPRGKRKIIAELIQKGIDSGLARQIVNEEIDSAKERKLAEEYCQKNNSLPPKKLAGRLKSRGFPGSIIYELTENR